jgi:hypothetical protein
MVGDLRDSRTSSASDYTPRRLRTARALFLTKLSKHLVLLACLMIVGRTTGQLLLGPVGIFLLILVATGIHCAGRSLERRPAYRPPLRRSS